uniref:5-formyltetrahydrofolate cyclo-ligase isoform X3 n=1 Tax=Halichoerus grypus TaxID=9711 RepID=UPI001659E57E|nr:5-formyltetrahydrofolate cyclo-ligase isoform X3 [Halichoerus grypus]
MFEMHLVVEDGFCQVMAHSRYQKSERISIFLSMQDEIETEEIIKDIFRRGKTCFIPRYQLQSNHMDMVKLASPEEVSSLPRTSWNIHQPGEDEVREEALSTVLHSARSYAPKVYSDLPPSCPASVDRRNANIMGRRVFKGRDCRIVWPRKEYNKESGCEFHQGGLDLIFMPGLGFDKQGNRLGRGRGYYDTYLKRCLQQQDVRPYTMALAFREQICLQVPVDENDMKVDEVLYEEPST